MTKERNRSESGEWPGLWLADQEPHPLEMIRAAIERALSPSATPTRQELVEMEQQLRAYVEQLLPSAEASVAELWHGSVAWQERRERLARIRSHAGHGLGDSPLSAHVQVRHLARDCAALLEYAEPTP